MKEQMEMPGVKIRLREVIAQEAVTIRRQGRGVSNSRRVEELRSCDRKHSQTIRKYQQV